MEITPIIIWQYSSPKSKEGAAYTYVHSGPSVSVSKDKATPGPGDYFES
jgi:hypothetical protein